MIALSRKRPKVFYLHFNRIAMQRGDPRVWSLRTSDGCFHAERVIVKANVESMFRPKARQPRAFFKGRGFWSWVNDGGRPVLVLTNLPPSRS